MMLEFDHLAVLTTRLDHGIAYVENALGVRLTPGGQHPHFGTHNAVLSLGPSEYLEVIAIDPDVPAPSYPRWFDLDQFQQAAQGQDVSLLGRWILRSDDLTSELTRLGPAVGSPIALSRGDLAWRMAVPETGALPYDNLHPALIGWDGPHPAERLPDIGCRLASLSVSHPDAHALCEQVNVSDHRISFVPAHDIGLIAEIETPQGRRQLK
jgi:hypothetical protein